jgi:hypothetical protein
MKNKDIAFKTFLALYAVLLVIHTAKLEWGLLVFIALVSGLLLAYFAHAKKGFLTLLLLAVHMSIEWSHHFEFGLAYTTGEYFLHGTHVVFDGVFLVAEWKRHSKNALKAVLAGVFIGVLSLMILGGHDHHEQYSYVSGVETITCEHGSEEHEHTQFPFEALVIGGILGCVATHLLEKKNKDIGSA